MFGMRGCGCFGVGFIFICIIGSLALYTFGLPRFHEYVGEPMQQAVSTEIARKIAIVPGSAPRSGTYTISQQELNDALATEAGGRLGIGSVSTAISPDGVTIHIKIQNQVVTYHGDIGAIGGKLIVANMTADGKFRYILPANAMANILENGINYYLVSRGLYLTDITLGNGTMTLTTASS